jgi:hypothetical protein
MGALRVSADFSKLRYPTAVNRWVAGSSPGPGSHPFQRPTRVPQLSVSRWVHSRVTRRPGIAPLRCFSASKHLDDIEALLTRDAQRIETACRRHLTSARKTLLASIS